MKVLRGKVVNSVSHSSKWMEKLENEYSKKTGINILPDTLNIQLEESLHIQSNILNNCQNMLCYLNGERVFIVKANHDSKHQPTMIEIATLANINDSFGLKDGDEVKVTIPEYV
ncbi:DUF120 domain-containing protein [Bacillus salitolerans]|uniref:DUF120 domain-containing protein n=1 Tax=Bacillus salitolerans TaxID=1437434 RepID=A0ABW4LQU7_9BACI